MACISLEATMQEMLNILISVLEIMKHKCGKFNQRWIVMNLRNNGKCHTNIKLMCYPSMLLQHILH